MPNIRFQQRIAVIFTYDDSKHGMINGYLSDELMVLTN